MTLAHAGLAIAMAGMIGSSAWKQEFIGVMQPGESQELAGYSFTLEKTESLPGPNYTSLFAYFTVSKEGEAIAALAPEKRLYFVQQMPTTEAAIHTTGFSDLYAVIGDESPEGFVVRLYFEPLVPWLWWGCGLMMLGGFLSLSDRRLRIGEPAARRQATPQPAE